VAEKQRNGHRDAQANDESYDEAEKGTAAL
jgi:hypothetical protein